MKYLYLMLIIWNINLLAHSQTPTKFGGQDDKLNTISTKQIKIVPITIQNLNNYAQKYHLLVNNQIIGKSNQLIKNQIYKVNIPVKINKPNQLEVHIICSLSIANNEKEMFRTKICTKAYLYWVKQ